MTIRLSVHQLTPIASIKRVVDPDLCCFPVLDVVVPELDGVTLGLDVPCQLSECLSRFVSLLDMLLNYYSVVVVEL